MKKMAFLTRLTLGAAMAFAAIAIPATKAHAAEDTTAQLQKAVAELSAEQQASLYLLLKGLKGGGAAAKDGKDSAAAPAASADPKVAGAAVVTGFFQAASSEDISKMMTFFSDKFDHYEYGDKQGVQDFLDQAINMGYMKDIKSETKDAEFEIKGDEMTIYPVDVTGAFGSITFEYTLKKEGNDWKIVGFDASGL